MTRDWLEHPEGELKRLREEREHERRERLEEAADREREREAARIGETGPEGWDPFPSAAPEGPRQRPSTSWGAWPPSSSAPSLSLSPATGS